VLVGDGSVTVAGYLIEDGQGVAHTAVGLDGDDGQGFVFSFRALRVGDAFQLIDDVVHADAVEIVDLATGKDGGNDFVFFRRSQDKDGVVWGLFQGLQKGVEGCRREHMNFIDDVHLVLAQLRGNAYLVDQGPDAVYRIIGGSVQFKDVEGTLVVETETGFTGIAGLSLWSRVQTIDGFGKNSGTGGFANASGTAKQVGVRQLVVFDRVFQRGCEGGLPDHRLKGVGAVFAG